MKLEPREIQTRIKHLILERYLDHWGGIIANGIRARGRSLRDSSSFTLRYVYVDGFAGPGRYSGDRGELLRGKNSEPVFGSPIIGVRALDKLRQYCLDKIPEIVTETVCVLCEKESDVFQKLLQSLSIAGVADRVIIDPAKIESGSILTLNVDFLETVDAVLSITEPPTFSLYFLDPYGPTGIPLSVVRRIINQQKTDTIINFPYQDLHKKAGHGKKELKSLPLADTKIVHNWSRVFGDVEDHWIKIWNEEHETNGTNAAERKVVMYYKAKLEATNKDIVVKLIPLSFPDAARTMFYLVLTTRDPSGALAMNQILQDARLEEQLLRSDFGIAQLAYTVAQEEERKGALNLFPIEDMLARPSLEPSERKVDIEAIRILMQENWAGKTVPFKQILEIFSDTDLTVKELRSAMTSLKRSGVLTYDKLTSNASLVEVKNVGH